ncbi:MAG: ABC transporter substrate-binding protein [Actinomycetota bacterium]
MASAAFMVLLAACTTVEAGTPASSPNQPVEQLKIAFIEDLSPAGAAGRTAPAFQGAKLALDTVALTGELDVSVELVALDTGGNARTAAAAAREVAADPSYVAAIGAPFLAGQVTIGRILDRAGVPLITLSTLGPNLSENGWTGWRRAVANQTRQGRALARYVDGLPASGRGVCLLGDGSEESSGLLHAVARSLRATILLKAKILPSAAGPPPAVTAVSRARCGVVVWGGFSDEGAPIRRHLVEAGLRRVNFVGGDGLKDETYLSVAGGAGVGTVATCPCADLTAATDLSAQRFIQDYQSDFGLPPAACAVEAFDVARMVLRAIRSGATTRAGVVRVLLGMPRFHGLGNVYVFRPDGELAPGSARVGLFRNEGGRWVEIRSPHARSSDTVRPAGA